MNREPTCAHEAKGRYAKEAMEAKKGRISNKRRLEKKTSVRNGPIAFGERVSTAEAAILRHEMETQSGLIDCARTKGRESKKTQLASPSPSDVDSRKSIRRKHPHTHADNFFFCRCTCDWRDENGREPTFCSYSHTFDAGQDTTGTSVSVNPLFLPFCLFSSLPSLFLF